MQPITIADVPRECGTRKKGGCYLDSDMAAGGSIEPLTWLLDWCVTDPPEAQFTVEVPPRAMLTIDPLASLLNRVLIPVGGWAGDLNFARHLTDGRTDGDLRYLARLGRFGLADHVGESFYTPWSFAQELKRLGPSRRVPHTIAAQMADRLPCPVLFFMPLPLLNNSAACEFMMNHGAEHAGLFEIAPTWYNPRFTFLARRYDGGPELPDAYHGEDHFMVDVLRVAAETKDGLPGAKMVEMPFALSVFTRATYILKDDEDALPAELAGSNVQPARLV